MGSSETKCSSCKHLKICKFADDFIALVEKVEKSTKDRLEIHCIEFNCEEYKQIQTSFIR